MVRVASRLLLPLVWLLELLVVVALALLLAAWFWSGSATSLDTLLREAPAYLPAGQTLEAQEVQGSIRKGGQIGLLRWSANGLTVSARDVQLAWQPLDLLRRRLNVSALKVAELVVDDRRPASPSAPEPPPEILLPLDIDLALAVDTIRLTGATAFEAHGLAARYQYEGQAHQLKITQLAVAQGQYQGTLHLQARLPMALDLQLTGQVQAPVGDGKTIALDASASANGPLAGMAPRLELQVLVQPGAGNSGAPAGGNRAMRADLSAQVNPWATQPVIRAQASFNQLDLAALWPTAPRTLLTGNTWVRPAGPNWLAELNLINRDEGPWDKGRLPLASVKGLVEYGGGRLRIESLNAEGAGGRVRLQARLADTRQLSATSGWQGQLQVKGVELSKVYSTLDPVRLDGSVNAVTAKDGVDFDAALQPAAEQPRASPLRGLQLQSAAAKGRWADGWLRVAKLDIRTRDARLDGRFELQPSTRDARGQLALNAPGLQASVSGDMAARDGKGVLALKLDDAGATRRWLARLPMAPAQLDTLDIRGGADIDLRWRSGWQALTTGGSGGAGVARIDATIRIVQLSLGSQGQAADQWIKLSAVDASLSGTIDALTLKAGGTVASGSAQAQLQAAATGGRTTRGDWQARVTALQVKARDSQLPGPWTLSLNQPVAISWTAPAPGTSGSPVLQVAASQAALVGPAPGTAQLVWQPITWQRGGRTELASKGALRGLPLGWLTLLGDTTLASAGLTGDLVFDGQWDVTLAETLSVRASLARRSGDLRVQTDSGSSNAQASIIDAGIRVLQLDLQGDGEALGARFRWDSARAGNAQMDISTRLTRTRDGWQWLPDSPIKGSLRAQMPQVGVWSLLAPPGWRVRGTVDAGLDLSGTRSAPQWNGHLDAREMALRSVVDGVEFGNGQLRATLQGQRLRIDSFSLQGAGGTSGGALTATGAATWQSPGNASASPFAGIELQIDAVAKALRVSARADRRLAVSGTLQASVRQSKLQVRGALTVDQALFILPDENAPSLGADVVVLRRESGGNAKSGSANKGAASPVLAADRSSDSTAANDRLVGDLRVKLDLGSDFRVRGRGIDTRVAGELELRSALQPGEAPVVTGQLRTVGGQFKAYGQQLEIERGLMRFTGAYDNPSLDILAIRPKLSQRVGVQVTGNALLPRIRLFAEPDLPDAEKLAWLVLGRSAANGGAEAAVLQQAAMALLGGQDSSGGIASRLGLDELSVSGASDSGSGGATGATLTLGKRISQNFYVTYERSLAGTLGTFSIFYDLSERFSLRARTGEKSAIDLIFKIRYE
jgi:translocation and assembly module TamB